MSNSALDKIFKQELDDAGFEYQEALWQRLDSQLQPVRNQRQPERRRRAAVLILLLLVAGGGAAWLATRQNDRTDVAAETAANRTATPGNSGGSAITATDADEPVQPKAAAVPEMVNPAAEVPPADEVPAGPSNSNTTAAYQAPVAPGAIDQSNNPVTTISSTRTKSRRTRVTVQPPMLVSNENIVEIKDEATTTAAKPEPTKSQAVVDVGADKTSTTALPAPVVNASVAQPAETAAGDKTLADAKPVTARAGKPKLERSRMAYHVTAGANWSSPFSKPGVFGGVLLTKTIGDKHLFAGIKLAGNRLHHQFTSASKINQTPVVTDAVIEKITTLQLPFGYEFGLNGGRKKTANTFLQLGFEPSFVTSVRTIFYDDNGIPGGPVTPVMNSPLLSKAINKFNVSFVAGIRKQISGNLGLSLTGGYNLIDITDKQYYNRTTRNNNMRYLQAGLQWRIHR